MRMMYVLIFSFIYAFMNEFIAYIGILYSYDRWNDNLPLFLRIFIYFINGVIAYSIWVRKYKMAYFLLFDIAIISINVFISGCEALYLLIGFSIFRYGYLGGVLADLAELMKQNNILSCDDGAIFLFIVFGIGGSLVAISVTILLHYFTLTIIRKIRRENDY